MERIGEKTMITARLIDVGRQHFNGDVQVETLKDLRKEIGKHLLSKNWALEFKDGDSKAIIVVGGFRTVGFVNLQNGVFSESLVMKGALEETKKP
jgi:hypothetical protein